MLRDCGTFTTVPEGSTSVTSANDFFLSVVSTRENPEHEKTLDFGVSRMFSPGPRYGYSKLTDSLLNRSGITYLRPHLRVDWRRWGWFRRKYCFTHFVVCSCKISDVDRKWLIYISRTRRHLYVKPVVKFKVETVYSRPARTLLMNSILDHYFLQVYIT